MKKIIDPKVWVELAEQHYLLAKVSYQHKPRLSYGVCYHANRCISAYLKATLIRAGEVFPGTHDLVYLKNLCYKSGVVLEFSNDDLDMLAELGSRVHNPTNTISNSELIEAYNIASDLRRKLRKLLNIY